jgi:hypothetical protein
MITKMEKNDSNLLDIVVARYSENLDWINNCSGHFVIYNKGEDTLNFPSNKIENVGHEGHTYIKHIVDNYDELAKYTIFVQGNPFEHSPDLCGKIDNITNVLESGNPFPDFYWLTRHMFRTDFEYKREPNCKLWPNIKYAYEKVFGSEPTMECLIFGGGAQFCVSKERIHERPLYFYKNILDIFEHVPEGNCWEEYDEFSQRLLGRGHCLAAGTPGWKRELFYPTNPEIGVYMERFWGAIFNDCYTGIVYDHLHGGPLQIKDGVPV